MSRLFLATMLLLGLSASASAQLTPEQRSEFFNACVNSCLPNSGQTLCNTYCGCVADEIHKWSRAEIAEMSRAYETDAPHPIKTRAEQLTVVCRQRLGL